METTFIDISTSKHTNMLELRPISRTSPQEIQILADNLNVSRHLRATFPHPYSIADAELFLSYCDDSAVMAIYYDEAFVGVISVQSHGDPDAAEIGYWLGEPFWGQGLATAALVQLLQKLGEESTLTRVFAKVYEENTASMRVLEKAGFHRTGSEEGVRTEVVFSCTLSDPHIYSLK
jgi:ribosomal-protein-alanine N-acetyltransferase